MSTKRTDPDRGELLVAIMNATNDFEILKAQGWYRIPVDTAPKRWPPQWIAFYTNHGFDLSAWYIKPKPCEPEEHHVSSRRPNQVCTP